MRTKTQLPSTDEYHYSPDIIDSKDTRKLAFFLYIIKQVLWAIMIAATSIVTVVFIAYSLWLFVSAGIEIVGSWLQMS